MSLWTTCRRTRRCGGVDALAAARGDQRVRAASCFSKRAPSLLDKHIDAVHDRWFA